VVLRLLKEFRRKAGITQVDLAAKLGQTQSFVSKAERGERRLDIVQLRTLCHLYSIRLLDFVERFETALKKKGSSRLVVGDFCL
jgi:transcriptional regulator with XRE-family HTH domain